MDNFGVRVFNKIPKITKKNFRLSKAKFQAVVFNEYSVKFVDQLYKLQSKLANLIPASLKAKLSKLIPIKFQSTLPKTQKKKLILASLSIGLLLVVFGLLPIIKNIKQSQQTKASGLQISNVYPAIGNNQGGDKLLIEGKGFNIPGVEFTKVSAGNYHTCAIATNGKTYCWGFNQYGYLGNGTTSSRLIPTEVINSDTLNFTQIAIGFYHTCAIATNGKTYCWGFNNQSQLGDNTTTQRNIPTEVTNSATLNFTQITAGIYHTCAITANNRTYCWGQNGNGQLGDNSTTNRPIPTEVSNSATLNFTQITAGSYHTCAIAANNRTYCWGRNDYGQLGDNSTTQRRIPREVTNSATLNFTQIVAGQNHTCAIAANNRTYCWGRNDYGELGDNSTTQRRIPREVANSANLNFTKLSVGFNAFHTCAIAANNRTYCWGQNGNGQLGDNTTTRRNIPTEVTNSSTLNFKQVSAGSTYTCAIATNNKTYCWGDNGFGQLGDNSKTQRLSPVAVVSPVIVGITQISAGGGSCAISSNNKTYCWGYNGDGQLGDNSTIDRFIPTEVTNSATLNFTQIVAGQAHTCAIAANNKTYCWGQNGNGQLGDNTTTRRHVPTEVTNSAVLNFKQIAIGTLHTCAIATNNRTYCWGDNSYGQLGDNTTTRRNIPTEVTNSSSLNFTKIYANHYHTCAIAANNRTYCWGDNSYGQLGDNTTTRRNIPTEVTNSSSLNFSQISVGGVHTCAIAANNRTYCWGWNNYGQLGNGATNNRHIPTEVTNSSNLAFTHIDSGHSQVCAISSNGKTYCWGLNSNGQIGDGTTNNRYVPTEVANSVNFKFVRFDVGFHHTCAIAANNRIYCWGNNSHGQLGIGTASGHYTTPVEIDPTNLLVSATSNLTATIAGINVNVNRISDTKLELITPPKPSHLPNESKVDITISNSPTETVTLSNAYTYYTPEAPVIDNISPDSIYVYGGEVTINGKNFNPLRWRQVASGYNHTCAISSNNKTYCWGKNNNGQLGDNSVVNRPVLTEVTNSATLNFTQITAGSYHTCAIASNNRTYCWGNNISGRLGDGSTTQRNIPTEVTNSATLNFTQIVAGGSHTCAISSNNRTYCWGSNTNGQLGDGTIIERNVPTETTNSAVLNFKQIAIGALHTCAISSNNKTYCWGYNIYGQLGDNTTTQRNIPTEVTNSATLNFTQIVAGGSHTCAIATNNKTYCWGDNSYGQLGINAYGRRNIPTEVTNSATLNFTQISTGYEHTCAIATNNKTYCWGNNSYGQLGDNTNAQRNIPTEVTNSVTLNFTQITTGSYHTCAIAANNRTYCWGSNNHGELGINTGRAFEKVAIETKSDIVIEFDGLPLIQDIYRRNDTDFDREIKIMVSSSLLPGTSNIKIKNLTLASTSNSVNLNYVNLPKPSINSLSPNFSEANKPTDISVAGQNLTDLKIAQLQLISSNDTHTCAIAANNRTYCWGRNDYGQLGDNTTAQHNIPTEVTNSATLNFTQIFAGNLHTCAISSNNKTYCWGNNISGQLGDNSTTNLSIPTEVTNSATLNFTQITTGSYYTCAIATNNKTYCWGRNNYGQLGDGTTNNRHVPTEVANSASLNFTKISAGYEHTCAIATNNKTYCWGRNDYGQLGDNTTTNRSIPTEVTNSATLNFTQIVAGQNHTCAISSNNKTYCWGHNGRGQLGDNKTDNRYTPSVVLIRDSLIVKFGDLLATNVSINVPIGQYITNSLTVKTPTHDIGKVLVAITNPDGQSSSTTMTDANTHTFYGKPKAPVDLTVVPFAPSGSVKLSFKSPSDNGIDSQASQGNGFGPITRYYVEFCSTDNNLTCADPSAGDANPYTNPVNWVPYVEHYDVTTSNSNQPLTIILGKLPSDFSSHFLFRVAAVNEFGTGEFSNVYYSQVSYLSLNLSAQPQINITPTHSNTFSSSKLTATIHVNIPTGYSLKLSAIGNQNQLIHTVNPAHVFNPVNSTFQTPTTLTTNTWGFRIPDSYTNQQQNNISLAQFGADDNNITNQPSHNLKYSPVPTVDQPLTICSYNQSALNKKLDLIFGVNSSQTQSVGSYQQKIRFEVVGQ